MRIGALVPFTNTNLEWDLIRMCPEGARIHFTRMAGYDADAIPDASAMHEMGEADIDEPLRLIAATEPDFVLYGCTSAVLTHGLAFERDLRAKIEAQTGARAVTAAGALVEALQFMNISSIGFVSPYVRRVNDLAISFFAEAGFRTVSRAEPREELDCRAQGSLTENEITDLAGDLDATLCDAVVLSCTDIGTTDVIARYEANTHTPMITSNQAMMFSVARLEPSLDWSRCPGALFENTLTCST